MREVPTQSDRTPRVVVEDFVAYRTVGSELVSKWSGRLAHFFEPGEIELNGDIKGIRFTKRGEETISSESVSVWFDTQSLTALAGEGKLQRAELKRFVEISAGGSVLLTDFAEYLADSNTLRSDRAVKIEGPNRQFSGEKGFLYEVSGDKLELFGKITGVMQIDSKQKP